MIKITFKELLKAKEALELATSGVAREIQNFISKHTSAEEHGVEVHKHLESLITTKKIFTVVEFHNGKVHSAVSFPDINKAEKKYIYEVGYLSNKKPVDIYEAEALNEELIKSGKNILIIFSTVTL